MPLPLGHTAIGLVTFETATSKSNCYSRFKLFIYLSILANLPDIDILTGLLFNGNGATFHRGPTHSLLFAVLAGSAVTLLSRYWKQIPSLGFVINSLLIFSHVIADLLLTAAPVSLLWPFEINWSTGHSGWGDVLNMAILQSFQDVVIAVCAVLYLVCLRQFRQKACFFDDRLAMAKNQIK